VSSTGNDHHPTHRPNAMTEETQTNDTKVEPSSDLVAHGLPEATGFKFEHILLSITIAHNREIGQFDDSCASQVRKAMLSYNGIHMVNAEAQYKHCSEQQHFEGCECGLCEQVRFAIKHGDNTYVPSQEEPA
jgi:hypothetical protein